MRSRFFFLYSAHSARCSGVERFGSPFFGGPVLGMVSLSLRQFLSPDHDYEEIVVARRNDREIERDRGFRLGREADDRGPVWQGRDGGWGVRERRCEGQGLSGGA